MCWCFSLIFSVTSAREWLTFECVSWVKQDPVTKSIDYQPILLFTVRQKTVGAKVVEEPILYTRKNNKYFTYLVNTM